VWVSPSADVDDTTAIVKELQVDSCTVFAATDVSGVGRPPTDAWDLVALRATYDAFIADCRRVIGLLQRGDTSPAKALQARTAVMDAYRRFPGLDPGLPAQLMPADWPRATARDVFVAAYDGLAPLAELRARQIVAAFDPDLAALVRCHLSTEVLDLLTA
jgi:phenylacetic acid degradation operon negative regulatory protein